MEHCLRLPTEQRKGYSVYRRNHDTWSAIDDEIPYNMGLGAPGRLEVLKMEYSPSRRVNSNEGAEYRCAETSSYLMVYEYSLLLGFKSRRLIHSNGRLFLMLNKSTCFSVRDPGTEHRGMDCLTMSTTQIPRTFAPRISNASEGKPTVLMERLAGNTASSRPEISFVFNFL